MPCASPIATAAEAAPRSVVWISSGVSPAARTVASPCAISGRTVSRTPRSSDDPVRNRNITGMVRKLIFA